MKFLAYLLVPALLAIAEKPYHPEANLCLDGESEKWQIYDSSEAKLDTVYGLKLEKKIRLDDSVLLVSSTGDSLQYVAHSTKDYDWLTSHLTQKIKVCGKLMSKFNDHHFTPILIIVDSVFVIEMRYKKVIPFKK